MKYCIGVYGDSISFGYGNNDTSWFDRLNGFVHKNKMAQNGETVENVFSKLLNDNNQYKILILAVGVNNFLQDFPQPDSSNVHQTLSVYEQIIELAKDKSEKFIIQNALPIIEERFPNQKYLDEPKWIYNSNIIAFNKGLYRLAKKHNVQLIDMHKVFDEKNLCDLYFDGVHPNINGQNLLLSVYQDILCNFVTLEKKNIDMK